MSNGEQDDFQEQMEIRIRQSIKIASAKTDVFIKCSGYPQKLCKSEHSRGIEFAHIDSKTVGRGFESSCPCHKGLKCLISGSFFLFYGGICPENVEKDGLDEPCRKRIEV